jgi:hypothetical protein
MGTRIVVTFAVALLAAGTAVRAQGIDPAREIQEIARAVEKQLQEIDQLLLESGRKNQSREQPKELLQKARDRAEAVEGGIDKLIEKLNEMKNQGGGGGSSDDQQQQDQQDQQQQDGQQQRQGQGQRNRRENQTPDFVKQPQAGEQPKPEPQPQGQPQPGEQQQPQPQGQPDNGQENPDGGANQRGNQPPQSETGPPNPGTGDGSWGDLQPYMNFLKNRGSRPPAVPEKYRKYWEAYLKQKQSTGAGNGGK